MGLYESNETFLSDKIYVKTFIYSKVRLCSG